MALFNHLVAVHAADLRCFQHLVEHGAQPHHDRSPNVRKLIGNWAILASPVRPQVLRQGARPLSPARVATTLVITHRSRRLRIAHEPLASPSRFKPPAAVLLIELVQHAGPLRPSHAGLDPGHGGLGARQDRGMVGERYAERAGSRRECRRRLFERAGARPVP